MGKRGKGCVTLTEGKVGGLVMGLWWGVVSN